MEKIKCSSCNEVKSVNDFTADKSRPTGRCWRCKSCCQIKARKFYINKTSKLTKTCTLCKRRKRNGNFYRDKTRGDGLYDRCKECVIMKKIESGENGVLKSKPAGNRKWASLDLPTKKCPCNLQSYLWQRSNPCTHSEVWDVANI